MKRKSIVVLIAVGCMVLLPGCGAKGKREGSGADAAAGMGWKHFIMQAMNIESAILQEKKRTNR